MPYELMIESMHCEHCSSNIERYLRSQPDVRAADVDFQTGSGRLELNDAGDITELVEAINAMGYDVPSKEQT